MTPGELEQLCISLHYTPTLVQGDHPRWQATSMDSRRRCVYLCKEGDLAKMSEDEVVAKLAVYRPKVRKLYITDLPDGKVELRRGPLRGRGTTAMVLDGGEIRRLLAHLHGEA